MTILEEILKEIRDILRGINAKTAGGEDSQGQFTLTREAVDKLRALGKDGKPFAKPTREQLGDRYLMRHALSVEQGRRCQRIREQLFETAALCVELTPCSAEQSRALEALDSAMSLFVAAVAHNEGEKLHLATTTLPGVRPKAE